MSNIRCCLNILLVLLAVCLWSPLHAAVAAIEPVSLAPVLRMIQSLPTFRASILAQITFVNSLSAQPVPTMAPIVSAAPTSSDPWHAQAARLVGALVAQPRTVALYQEELRTTLGDQGADQLKKAATSLQAHAMEHPELNAQLKILRRRLNFNDAGDVQGLFVCLNTLFENLKSRPDGASVGAVLASDPSQKSMRKSNSWKLQRNERPAAKAVIPKPPPMGWLSAYDPAILGRIKDRYPRVFQTLVALAQGREPTLPPPAQRIPEGFVREDLKRRYGDDLGKPVTLYRGIDLADFSPDFIGEKRLVWMTERLEDALAYAADSEEQRAITLLRLQVLRFLVYKRSGWPVLRWEDIPDYGAFIAAVATIQPGPNLRRALHDNIGDEKAYLRAVNKDIPGFSRGRGWKEYAPQ